MFRNGHENDSRDSFQRGSSLGKSGKVEKQKGRKKKILLFLFFLCIAREPVFQAERVPERADRTLLFPRWGNQHLRESHGKAYADAYAFFFCAEN